jgi:hypothetical protein
MMSKPPKFSVVQGDGPGDEENQFSVVQGDEPGDEENRWRQWHGVILPFYPNADDPSECERYIKRVFEAVVKHYGEDEARRIFGPYGKPRTKRDIRLEENALLFLEYWLAGLEAGAETGTETPGTEPKLREPKWRKPNIRQLAIRLAGEKNKDVDALERKIWRAINDERVRRYVEEHEL